MKTKRWLDYFLSLVKSIPEVGAVQISRSDKHFYDFHVTIFIVDKDPDLKLTQEIIRYEIDTAESFPEFILDFRTLRVPASKLEALDKTVKTIYLRK